jgi:hypothetical protein
MSKDELSERDLALLGDLIRLLRKHGPEAFKSLAASLGDAGWSDRMAAILTAVAEATPQRRITSRPTRSRSTFERVNAQLQHLDPERLTLLRPIAERLVAGEWLPRMKDVAEFTAIAGFPALRTKSRSDAIVALVRNMAAMPADQLERLAQELGASVGEDQRSLEGWNRIIERSRAETISPRAK